MSAAPSAPLAESASRYHGIAGAHQPLARQRERDARGVDSDPAPPPLLSHIAVVPEPQVGSSTRSPGSVHISMQRSTTLAVRLNDVDLVFR